MKKVMNTLTGRPGSLPQQPFEAFLSNILYIERSLVDTLPELIGEASDAELRGSLQTHLDETREHVSNVERMFEAYGAEPVAERSPLMDALKETHTVLKGKTSEANRDLVVAAAAATTEHVEIAVYTALRQIAEAVGNSEVVGLIDKNLAQEQHALQLAGKALGKLARERGGDLVS